MHGQHSSCKELWERDFEASTSGVDSNRLAIEDIHAESDISLLVEQQAKNAKAFTA